MKHVLGVIKFSFRVFSHHKETTSLDGGDKRGGEWQLVAMKTVPSPWVEQNAVMEQDSETKMISSSISLPAEAPLSGSCDKNREVDGGRNAELENDGEERS